MENDRLLEILKIMVKCLEGIGIFSFEHGLCYLCDKMIFSGLIDSYEKDQIIYLLWWHFQRTGAATKNDIIYRDYWWPHNEAGPRIQFLKKVIKQYE